MDHEFEFLKKRYGLKNLKLYYNQDFLKKQDIEAHFNYILFEIVLVDRKVCRRRLLSLLHEIYHAKQFKEKRLIVSKRNLHKMYVQEFEAEMFAIREYEKLYSKKYGTCLNEPWSLATYEDYKKHFKKQVGPGYG